MSWCLVSLVFKALVCSSPKQSSNDCLLKQQKRQWCAPHLELFASGLCALGEGKRHAWLTGWFARCAMQVDIYSFGVVLWELVSGEMPQRGRLHDLQVLLGLHS